MLWLEQLTEKSRFSVVGGGSSDRSDHLLATGLFGDMPFNVAGPTVSQMLILTTNLDFVYVLNQCLFVWITVQNGIVRRAGKSSIQMLLRRIK